MARRIQKVRRAGSTPIRYIVRQAPGPFAPTNSQVTDARKKPIPKPDWNSPLPLPRAPSGQNSAVIEVPVTHSEPMASPARKRKAAKEVQSQENALIAVTTESVRIAHIIFPIPPLYSHTTTP